MNGRLAFLEALRYARTRLEEIEAFPVGALDKASLLSQRDQIGQS